jgi:hypothetical protein
MSMPGDTNTSVTLLDNMVHGFVWCTNKRPDRLQVRSPGEVDADGW